MFAVITDTIREADIYGRFDLPEYWTKYVDTPLTDKAVWELRKSVNRQSPYGEEQWQRAIAEKLGLESTIRHRGTEKKY